MSKRVLTQVAAIRPRELRVGPDNVTTGGKRVEAQLGGPSSRLTFRSPLPAHHWRQQERKCSYGALRKGIDKFERDGSTTESGIYGNATCD